MATARQREAWDHTCQIVALLANIHRDPKKQRKPYDPVTMNPYRQREKRRRPKPPKAPITVLKDVFVREKSA